MNDKPVADSPLALSGPAATTKGSFIERHWQKLVAAALWLALTGGLFTYIQLNDLTVTQLLRRLVTLMQTPAGPLIFILVYALRPLTFFSATVLTLAGGALFGPVLGIFYTIIASNISATVAYFMGRTLGGGLVDESRTGGLVQRYADRMRQNSFETTLIMRFIFLPYDLVSYLAGFLRIDYKAFILATILGSIPGTVSFVLAGASVRIDDVFEDNFRPTFNPWTLAASAALFVVSLAFSRFLKRREGQHDDKTSG